jgi:hypothetical protein
VSAGWEPAYQALALQRGCTTQRANQHRR